MLGFGPGLSLWTNVAAMGGSASVATSTFSPTASNSNYTLSNGNLTATATASGADIMAQGSAAKTSGYFEVTVTTAPGQSNIGVCKTTEANNTWLGSDTSGYAYASNGNVYTNATPTSGFASYGLDTIGVCIKANMLYFSKNGVWQNSADPSAGTGGIDISAINGSGVLVAVSTSHLNAFNLNTGGSAFSYAVPTGVSAWG